MPAGDPGQGSMITEVTKQLQELDEAEREIDERIRKAVETASERPVVRDPILYGRDRRVRPGRTC